MKDVEIIRTEVIEVKDSRLDDYGNLIVQDTNNNEYRVNKKHEYLHPTFQVGAVVQVGFGEYMKKEFIHTASLSGDYTPPDKVTPKTETKPRPVTPKPDIAPQEKGMWWKEAGENFRSGLFKKDDGKDGTQLWKAYTKQMLTSLEITIEK